MRTTFCFLTWALLTAFSVNSWAVGTEISGGGGNGISAEFKSIGNKALDTLINRNGATEEMTLDQLDQMKAVFQKTKVVVTPQKLTLRGVSVTAINFPDRNGILVNKDDWKSLDRQAKLQLVIHEIIGVALSGQIDDSDYKTSETLAALAGTSSEETVALAMARANFWGGGNKIRVQTNRTKVVKKYGPKGDEGVITAVYVQTFENGNPDSVRIYWVYTEVHGIIEKCELHSSEGSIGP